MDAAANEMERYPTTFKPKSRITEGTGALILVLSRVITPWPLTTMPWAFVTLLTILPYTIAFALTTGSGGDRTYLCQESPWYGDILVSLPTMSAFNTALFVDMLVASLTVLESSPCKNAADTSPDNLILEMLKYDGM